MNKPDKYRAQLLCFLENDENYQEMWDWIEELPELDQPDVFRLLVTLLIPFFFFFKDIFCANEKIKMLAISGSVFTFFYAVCGLTEYYLFFLSTTYIYFLILATLISFIIIEKHHLRNSNVLSK